MKAVGDELLLTIGCGNASYTTRTVKIIDVNKEFRVMLSGGGLSLTLDAHECDRLGVCGVSHMINHHINSTATALTQNRLAVIALAAQRIAYSSTGGTIEKLGATRAKTLDIKRQYQMTMQSSKGKV